MAAQFVNNGLSAVDALNKSYGIWIPATRIRRSPDVTHWSVADHAIGKGSAVGEYVGDKSEYSEEKYKIDFEIWMEDFKLQFERRNIERSQPPLDYTPVGAETSDTNTPAMDSSAIK